MGGVEGGLENRAPLVHPQLNCKVPSYTAVLTFHMPFHPWCFLALDVDTWTGGASMALRERLLLRPFLDLSLHALQPEFPIPHDADC